ncbi:hras-like suppressor 3 [Plakobranchus ocellatus]|uniref:Hras-like suppressor 3 n=1 Tax=Plakobranchus ocellatus TaxID=259542 RepID=A0AAV3Y0U0_9GAST|nr:hras-like suppressor 3 [Plakobranchus ocellatus]
MISLDDGNGTSASIQTVKSIKFCKNDATLASLQPGDLVKFKRHGYSHWAVYIGNDQVAHVAEQDQEGRPPDKSLVRASLELSKVQISVQNFWAVAKSDQAIKANDRDKDWSPLPSEEIVDRATSYLGEVRYNLLTSNCEHFAKWCRYDKFHSDQVDRLHIYKYDAVKSVVLTAVETARSTVLAIHKAKHFVTSQVSNQLSRRGRVHILSSNGGVARTAEYEDNVDDSSTQDENTESEAVREIMSVAETQRALSPSNVVYNVQHLNSF